jgi:lipopolysaccharide/colanic/teichoic acid biosynthesis glycosyltransferase
MDIVNVEKTIKFSGQGKTMEFDYVNQMDLSSPRPISKSLLIVKKIIDILGSVTGILLALPIIILVIIIIKVTSKGPVLYMHERIGQFGVPFKMCKFRSMYINAEEEGPQLSSKGDSRITSIGKFMRRWRLDEIPNLINVFKGEMSLVGPRPERKYYIDQIVQYAPEFIRLQQVKPGVTSLGQVKFGYAENVDEMIIRMKFDLYYIDNNSLLLDIIILMKTIAIILKGKGV